MSYVYVNSEPGLWTTGFYDPSGKWHPDKDFGSPDEAADRVIILNGGTPEPKKKPEPDKTIGLRNEILTIYTYKYFDDWVFDDARVGLDKEAFVAGADTLLDELTGNGDKATVLFSIHPFPTADVELDLITSDETGSSYYCSRFKHSVWLCPALFLYFEWAPDKIYVQVKPK